jgi:hypothetical protein
LVDDLVRAIWDINLADRATWAGWNWLGETDRKHWRI